MELPQEFLARMKKMLGDEYGEFLRTYEKPRQFGLRVNTLKIGVEEFVKLAPFHLRKIPWTDNGFYYERKDDPARHPFYYAGLYYLQEPSAMLPAQVLPVSPGERVLDLCAAPGGKATELAAKLRGQGLLVANEISASRAKALLKNLEVFGAGNTFITNTSANRLAEQFPEYFDKILVDAPCSGEGMFHKDIANARVWSMEKVHDCARTQRDLVTQAVKMLRPGGMLLYSTCTFALEENEGTVGYLLKHCPEMELQEIPWHSGFSHGRADYLCDEDVAGQTFEQCIRIFPHKADGEGHFLALLRKNAQQLSGGTPRRVQPNGLGGAKGATASERTSRQSRSGRLVSEQRSGRLSADEEKALRSFLQDVSTGYSIEQIEIHNGQVYYVPTPMQLSGKIPFLRNGLYLGEVRHGRMEPSQAFAMALQPETYASTVDFSQSDTRVYRYLRGETVEVDDLPLGRDKGWQLVCVCGYPLGWGKLVNGILKNKYHPGWRIQV